MFCAGVSGGGKDACHVSYSSKTDEIVIWYKNADELKKGVSEVAAAAGSQ